MSVPEQIKLSWEDPTTGDLREPKFYLPIAIGRDAGSLPTSLNGKRVTRLVLDSGEVSRYHALIEADADGIKVQDQNSTNGLSVNGQKQTLYNLANGDTIQIGPFEITVGWGSDQSTVVVPSHQSQILFNPRTNLLDPNLSRPVSPPPSRQEQFPPPFFERPTISVQDVYATGLPVDETEYLTVGAGLGSYIFADYLRIFGVSANRIVALGIDPHPYSRYKQLCLNSQIPDHERLRSNSDSCPDNIWGFPSYAWREAWHDLIHGKIHHGLRYIWQVFGEPTLVQTYTPRAGRVFDSIEREARRIGWSQMYHFGRVLGIRKTDDDRYVVAYSRSTAARRERAFYLTRYLHLATGYPAIKFLPDLQAYRLKTGDFKSVVNAYEDHAHVYEYLRTYGGTVLIRGRGIVASRIIQRIYEIRRDNPNLKVRVIHLMRSPKPQGNKYGAAQRTVEHHFEFQPFNWPKACWGGDLRFELEAASPDKRKQLITDWGGTTTADRLDWREMIARGLAEGWYRIEFGQVEKVEKEPEGLVTYIQEKNYQGDIRLLANFIIDATGLDADVTSSPLLDDLVGQYNLQLNYAKRLAVSNSFEVEAMRTSRGAMYAVGAITLGGPYAAVDSFLGLQYACLKIVDHLAEHRAPGLKKLDGWRSFGQWWKWAANQSP